jgi:hypothetical protein
VRLPEKRGSREVGTPISGRIAVVLLAVGREHGPVRAWLAAVDERTAARRRNLEEEKGDPGS